MSVKTTVLQGTHDRSLNLKDRQQDWNLNNLCDLRHCSAFLSLGFVEEILQQEEKGDASVEPPMQTEVT